MVRFISAILLCGWSQGVNAIQDVRYGEPSPEIVELARAPWLPLTVIDPTKRFLLQLGLKGLIPMDRLAREEIRLAGRILHPETLAPNRSLYLDRLTLVRIEEGPPMPVTGLPADPIILTVRWSPNGSWLALLLEEENGVGLWKMDTRTAKAERWSGIRIHPGLGATMQWGSSSQSLWLKSVPKNWRDPPGEDSASDGPVVHVTRDRALPAYTFQDLLETAEDVKRFEYYFSSQITCVRLNGDTVHVGNPGLFRSIQPSPDGKYLLVERLVEPWSDMVPEERFGYHWEVWTVRDGYLKTVATAPLGEAMSSSKSAVHPGARGVRWRPDAPATLVWVEAQDGGDFRRKARIRDILYSLKAPFAGPPEVLARLRQRLADVIWHSGDLALLVLLNGEEREMSFLRMYPDRGERKSPRRLITNKVGDRYKHSGYPLITYNEKGLPILQTDEGADHIYLVGDGGTREGDRPFLVKFNLLTKRKKEIFRSQPPFYERPHTLLDTKRNRLLVQRESRKMPPNHFLWNPEDKFERSITRESNSYRLLNGMQHRILRYKRSDYLELTANLYLPSGYDPERDGPLPTLIWAYPKSYSDPSYAAQTNFSPYEFYEARWYRPAIWVRRGYAVVDGPPMPIIGRNKASPNDDFIRQIKLSAQALVSRLLRLGISEKGRIGIGGNSYGAFLAVNLLANTDLFSAGIARNGAYNRTLTPFGFQNEERFFWQVPNVYLQMSPLFRVQNIREPLLLFHGRKDDNSGTFPLQSERMFQAIRGMGGTARLVLFPHEGHTFRGDKSILHMLAEMEQWLDLYVKKDPSNPNRSNWAQDDFPAVGDVWHIEAEDERPSGSAP